MYCHLASIWYDVDRHGGEALAELRQSRLSVNLRHPFALLLACVLFFYLPVATCRLRPQPLTIEPPIKNVAPRTVLEGIARPGPFIVVHVEILLKRGKCNIAEQGRDSLVNLLLQSRPVVIERIISGCSELHAVFLIFDVVGHGR